MRTAANVAVGRLVLTTAYARYNEARPTPLKVPRYSSLFTLVDSIGVEYLRQGIFEEGMPDFTLMTKLIAWRAMCRGISLDKDVEVMWPYTLYELHAVLVGNELRELVPGSEDVDLIAHLRALYNDTEQDRTKLGAFGQLVYDLMLNRWIRNRGNTDNKTGRFFRKAIHEAALRCQHSSTIADRRSATTEAIQVFRQQFPARVRPQTTGLTENLWSVLGHFIDDPSLWRRLPDG